MIVLIGLAIASQSATAEFGVTAENRTGQRPLVVGGTDELVTEFELTPSGRIDIRGKRTGFNISYSPRAYYRINLERENTIQRPLVLHGFGVGLTQAFSRTVNLSFNANGSVGEVDYSNINLVQGTAQQVPGCDPNDPSTCTSAAGGLPDARETFATQNYSAGLNLNWRTSRRHTIIVSAGGNYNSSFGANPVFPDNYGGTGGLAWNWRFHPNYGLNLSGTYSESRVDPESEPDPGISRFRSFAFNLGFDLRFSRLFNMSIGGGVLVTDNRPALLPGQMAANTGSRASPLADVSFTFIPTSGRGAVHVTTTFGAGLEGFVDPLSQGYVSRVAVSWNLNVFFYDDWGFTPNASLFTPISNPDSTAMNALNETLVSASIPLSYHINDELDFAIGARISGRGTSLREDPVVFDDWFVLGFLSFTAGVATRL
jgi:hypothetical protein